MDKKKKPKAMNPYIKDAEKIPCTYCKMVKPANNNISTMIDDKNIKIKNNKNNLSQKTIFGSCKKDVKKDVKKSKKKKK
jgi:hypothetical protein